MRPMNRVRCAVVAVGMSVAAIAPAMANSILLKIPGVTGPVTNAAEKFQFTYRSVSPNGAVGKVETFNWDCATNSAT